MRKRIAIIGAGITGMGAAWRLGIRHDVTLFEAGADLGGHACTLEAGRNGDQPVDIGFIVFNHANYPCLSELFAELDVPTAPAQMTFGVSIEGGRVEYALKDLNALFAQRRNLVRPAYWQLLRDVLRFNARGAAYAGDDGMTVAEMLRDLRTGPWFRDYYLLPFSGAIWSTPTVEVLNFPAAPMIRFFQNHNLMDVKGQHQWYTVAGGSREYVRRLEAGLTDRGVAIRKGTPIEQVLRPDGGVRVKPVGGDWEAYDEVIFATHSDDSIRMLGDATSAEQGSVGQISYQPNDVVLHSDPALMPKRRRAWASWVYAEDSNRRSDRIDLTYWMNSLQPIPQDDPLFVTLNTERDIRPDLLHHHTTFRHPVYDLAAVSAQRVVRARNGSRNTWFCGAWMGNGFHEDGLASGYEVADALLARAAQSRAA